MLRKITNIVIIILLVLGLTSFVGCGNKKEKKEAKEIERLKQERAKKQKEKEKTKEEVAEETVVTVEKEAEKKSPKQYTGKKEYELQLAARRSRDRVEITSEKFKKYGYDTKISLTYKDGKKYYRLRMKGLYTKQEAKDLGEKLKNQFPSIQNYWIQRVN